MPDYRLSERARRDLRQIYRYSVRTFGVSRTESYFRDLESHLNRIAANPRLGHGIDAIRRNYFRWEAGSHSIFYRPEGDELLIVRILHKRMDPTRHL